MGQKNLSFKNKLISLFAIIMRRFHPRGSMRLARFLYHPDKRLNDYFETIICIDGMAVNISTNSYIEWCAFFFKYYEKDITDLIKKYVKKNFVCVDVGANIGLHTLSMSQLAKKVYAIEPVDFLMSRLQKNCLLNNISNVSFLSCAVDDRSGFTDFFLPSEDSTHKGIGSLYQDHARGVKIKVERKTLDILFPDECIDFIKIDTEGNDSRVLLGGRKLLQRCHPIIIFEKSTKDNFDYSFLKDFGYTLTKVGKENIFAV